MMERADHSSPPMRTRPPDWSTRCSTSARAPSSAAVPVRSAGGIRRCAQASHAATCQSLGAVTTGARSVISVVTLEAGGDDDEVRCGAPARSTRERRCVPRALRALRGAHPRIPPAPLTLTGRGPRSHGGDVRAGVGEPQALPRRGGRVGGAPALRHRAQRSPRERPPRTHRARNLRAARPLRAARSCAGTRRAPRGVAGGHRRDALGAAPGRARRRRAARPRRPRLRDGRTHARDDAAGGAGPRLARARRATATLHEPDGGCVMTIHPELTALGDALERAAARDLRRRFLHPSRRLAVALVAAAVAVPAAAVGAVELMGGDQVAQTLEPGAAIFAGADPTCTIVRANVEYHCVLAKPPLPEVQDFKGTVEPTVDATKHVNGGCRSLTSDGLSWECYLGEEAVRQQIVSEGFLGADAPSPRP